MSHPNIIYIMADDMGYGDPGCFGSTRIPTPHMDRLAREGVRLTDAHSSASVCTPSRYSVLTGRYCWRTGMEKWVLGGFGTPLIEPERMTVAALLKAQGYATAAVGKWHVGLDWARKDGSQETVLDFGNPAWSVDGFDIDFTAPVTGGPRGLGFDYFFGIAGSLDMPPYCFIENEQTVGVPDREKEVYYNQQRRGPQTADWRDELVDVTFARKAVDFLEAHAADAPDRPFFLYLTPSSPHRPCDIRPDFVVGASEAGDRGDTVVLFDWVVGQVLEALDRLGLTDDTLVIVTSDNGGQLTCADGNAYGHRTNGALRGQKADIWDGGHREPFLARWPGNIPAGSTCDQLVCLSDFMATCAEIVGTPLPPDVAEDSLSFLDAMTGRGATPRRTMVHHSVHAMFSMRDGAWKAVFGLGSGGFSEPAFETADAGGPTGQLYNLADDPAETVNLWQQRPDKVQELEALFQHVRDANHRALGA